MSETYWIRCPLCDSPHVSPVDDYVECLECHCVGSSKMWNTRRFTRRVALRLTEQAANHSYYIPAATYAEEKVDGFISARLLEDQ